jgi:hypothetical protein
MSYWDGFSEQLRCPSCGSTNLNRSRSSFVTRSVLRVFAKHRYRCSFCHKRFYSTLEPADTQRKELWLALDHPIELQNHIKPARIPHPGTDAPPVTLSNPQTETERRRFLRLPCQIPAQVTFSSGADISTVVTNISLNGCFLELRDPVPAGAQIAVALQIGGGVQSPALVRRSLATKGMGVEFIGMTAPNFRRLQSLARESIRLR